MSILFGLDVQLEVISVANLIELGQVEHETAI